MPSRLRPAGSAVVAIAAVFAAAGPAVDAQNPAQAPPRQAVFRAGTMLVPIDVRVLDKQGKPVTDLTAADFTVLEDRRPQRVEHFWTQSLADAAPTEAAAPLARLTDARTVGPQTRRIFLIVLGRGRLQPPAKGVDGVLHLVRERLMPQDSVAVLAWNRATDFTTDHAKVVDVLERFKKSHERIEAKLRQQFSGLAAVYGGSRINPATQADIDAVFHGPGVAVRSLEGAEAADQARINQDTRRATEALQRAEILNGRPPGSTLSDAVDPVESLGLAGMSFDAYVESNTQSMQDLSRLYSGINYLRQLDGEKHLLFVSEHGVMLPRGEDDRSVAALAADARVVIDIIHTGGVPFSGGPNWAAATARTVSEQTGGTFTGNAMAARAVDAIDTATRFQYVLGYYTPSPLLDGRYRRVVVRVNRPDVTVLYRHGYFARQEPPPIERRQMLSQTRIAAAGSYAGAVPDIKVFAKATASPAGVTPLEVVLEARIDAARVSLKLIDGRYAGSLDVTVFCGDARERLVGQSWQRINLNLLEGSRLQLLSEGIPFTIRIPVRLPAAYAKVVVYDYGADLLGSVIVKITR